MKKFIEIHQISEKVMLCNVGIVYVFVLLTLIFKPISLLLAISICALLLTTAVCGIISLIYLIKIMNDEMVKLVNNHVKEHNK